MYCECINTGFTSAPSPTFKDGQEQCYSNIENYVAALKTGAFVQVYVSPVSGSTVLATPPIFYDPTSTTVVNYACSGQSATAITCVATNLTEEMLE